MEQVTKRYAVVTGANKGIGFEICRQLSSNGVTTVVLTARDEMRGLKSVEKLKQSGYHNVIFHQLDVMNSASVESLADFIKCQFGKLDILVNNAGIGGVVLTVDADVLSGFVKGQENDSIPKPKLVVLEPGIEKIPEHPRDGVAMKFEEIITDNYELAENCVQTNYYGAKRMCGALIPLLQLSASPRIVNVSSSMGKLENVPNEWAKGVFSDAENLTEERVEMVLSQYLNDFKEGSLKTNNWPASLSAYILSKAALNAYTRILANKYPNFCINCTCPGNIKTDGNFNLGKLSAEEGAAAPVWLALLPDGGTSGKFFLRKEETSF